MYRYLLVLSVLVFAGFSASARQSQKSPGAAPAAPAPSADTKTAPGGQPGGTPVKSSPESIAQGKKVYGYDCAMCHGVDGDGKGDLAVDMKLKLLDYRDPTSLRDKTDEDLFRIIQKGKGDMPQEGDRAKPDGLWNLVNYIRSFAKKEAEAKEKPPST